jgi:hypothetical protein
MATAEHNFQKYEIDKFLRAALDNPNQLERQGEIRFFAHAICRVTMRDGPDQDTAKCAHTCPAGKSDKTFARIPRLRERRPSAMFATIDGLCRMPQTFAACAPFVPPPATS